MGEKVALLDWQHDLSFVGRDRVLSGVCVRGGLRAGGDVLDLHGWVQSGGSGCGSSGCPGTADASYDEVEVGLLPPPPPYCAKYSFQAS